MSWLNGKMVGGNKNIPRFSSFKRYLYRTLYSIVKIAAGRGSGFPCKSLRGRYRGVNAREALRMGIPAPLVKPTARRLWCT